MNGQREQTISRLQELRGSLARQLAEIDCQLSELEGHKPPPVLICACGRPMDDEALDTWVCCGCGRGLG